MTIFLHIGIAKTGTTAIQTFCGAHRAELKTHGLLYPLSLGIDAHAVLPFAAMDFSAAVSNKLRNVKTEADHQRYREAQQQRFVDEARDAGCPHILISAEYLQAYLRTEREIARVRDFLAPLNQQVTVLLYLRRPDEWVASWYAERVRMGYAGDFEQWFCQEQLTHHILDYAGTIDRWGVGFGQQSIVIRAYDRKHLHHGDVVADILHQIGVPDALRHKPSNVRTSLGADAVAFLARFNAEIAKAPPALRDTLRAKEVREFIGRCAQTAGGTEPFKLPPAALQSPALIRVTAEYDALCAKPRV